MNRAILALLLILSVNHAATDESYGNLQFSSGEKRVALLELYTSEGCSSCPPADRWLSELKNESGLWTDFVPIALHVDYWDYIGWEDRFAHADFTERQRRHVDESAARAVYTPGFFQNGDEWLAWRYGELPHVPTDTVGDLNLRLSGNAFDASFRSNDKRIDKLQLHVAIVGMGLKTRVRAGENNGRMLSHDFVVLDLSHHAMKKQGSAYTVSSALPTKPNVTDKLALVAWVSANELQQPLQAVGGYVGLRDQ